MTDIELASYVLLLGLAWFFFDVFVPKRRLFQLSSESTYLGIPADLDYPCDGVFVHSGRAVENCVRVSALQRVPRVEYEEDLWRGRVLFSEERAGMLFYATELPEAAREATETPLRAVHLIRKVCIK